MAQEPQPNNIIGQGRFPPAAPSGSGPSDPTVEARLARLEAGIDQIRLDLAEIKGKLSNMPTTATLFGLVVTVFAAGFGMSLAVLKIASSH
jgi:hypothetical protein